MFLARTSWLDRWVDANPVAAVAALVGVLAACVLWMRWKGRRDLQPLCDELGFAFDPGLLGYRTVHGEIDGRNATVALRHRGLRAVDRYALIVIDSNSDAGVRFVAQHRPLLQHWVPLAPGIDGVKLQNADTGDATFDGRWRIGIDDVSRVAEIFDADTRNALAEIARGFVDLRYDGNQVRMEIPAHRLLFDGEAIRRALDVAVLLAQRL